MASVDDYLALVPSANKVQPKFMAMIALTVQPMVDTINLVESIPSLLDVDLAVGQALDIVGEWVNLSRTLRAPITGVYFAFDTVGLGFDEGIWFSSDDPATGIVVLDDETYRTMLKLKIAANVWDGSMEWANQALQNAFGTQGDPPVVWIEDNFDMTMSYMTSSMVALIQQLVAGGYMPFKVAGVRLA